MKITNIKPLLKEILTNSLLSRDNDMYLLFLVWDKAHPNIENKRFWELKYEAQAGDLIHFERVRRARQSLQAKHHELRGFSYNKRHGILQEETLENLGYIKTQPDAQGMTP